MHGKNEFLSKISSFLYHMMIRSIQISRYNILSNILNKILNINQKNFRLLSI